MTQSLALVQQRLAQHYVDTLRRANTAIQRGRGNREHWYNQIEQDWEQIRHWQTWSASASELERERSKLCVDFSIGGLEVLRVRQTPAERIQWMKTALEAARKTGNTAAERTTLHELGHTYFYIGATGDSTAAAHQLLQLAKATNDTFNLGRAWYILGQVGIYQGKLEDAEAALTKSIALLQQVGAEAEYGRALQALGRIPLYRGETRKAYDMFAQYLDIVERSGREAELAPAYITMNHVLLELHDYQQAKLYAERALRVCLKTGFQRMLANAWLSLGAAEAELDELNDACAHYLQGITSARALQAISTQIDLLRNLADAEMRLNQHANAYEHLQEALELARQQNIPYYLCDISAVLARWHIEQRQTDAARAQLRAAFAFADQMKNDRFLVVAFIPALMLLQLEQQAEQAAIWFGVLTRYKDYFEPRLYASLDTSLRQTLSDAQLAQFLERGSSIPLDAAIADFLARIN